MGKDGLFGMFSVADFLKLPCMKGAELIAGSNGLNRRIVWSHVIEHEDIEQWIKKDVLIISTGIGLHDIENGLFHMLSSAIHAQASGLVLSLGEYITEKPKTSFLRLADAENFPIVLIPQDMPIISITFQVAQSVFRSRSEDFIFPEKSLNLLNDRYKRSGLKSGDELYQTLVTYLDTGGNATQSAQLLYIHRNTMKYRIKKLEDLLDCNLRDEETRFMLRCIL